MLYLSWVCKCFPALLGNVSHPYWETFQSLLGNISHPYWETFPIPSGKRFPSLLGNVSHPYWEMFPIPTDKCFPSLLGKVPQLSWERFPILTGKHFRYSGESFSPLWLENIYSSQWDIILITSGKYLLILLGNVPFSLFNIEIMSILCNSRQTA